MSRRFWINTRFNSRLDVWTCQPSSLLACEGGGSELDAAKLLRLKRLTSFAVGDVEIRNIDDLVDLDIREIWLEDTVLHSPISLSKWSSLEIAVLDDVSPPVDFGGLEDNVSLRVIGVKAGLAWTSRAEISSIPNVSARDEHCRQAA